MVIFSLKLLNNLRKAIAGRKFPHQLAGGVALGVLLGVIPHGNLLALAVLITILCFRVNHAMVGVVAIVISFVAARLDDYSHSIGEAVLTNPTGNQIATAAYGLPLVPWTDLNNTVVLGSFVIGVAAVLPIFMLALPLFRFMAPAVETPTVETPAVETSAIQSPVAEAASADEAPATLSMTSRHSVAIVDVSHDEVLPPRYAENNASDNARQHSPAIIPIDSVLASEVEFVPTTQNESVRIDDLAERTVAPLSEASDGIPTQDEMVSVETRIDVIRMNDYRADSNGDLDTSSIVDGESSDLKNEPEQPMDEALSYLLRQLRDSQQRKAG